MSSKALTPSNPKVVNWLSPKDNTNDLDTPIRRPNHVDSLILQAKLNPRALVPRDMLRLQGVIGNQAVGRLVTQTTQPHAQKNRNSKSGIIQRKIIARIRTEPGGENLPRTISEVRLEGRAPTDILGGNQGDHTVAETLINESVRQEITGMPRKVALNNLMVLAQLTLPDDNIHELNTNFYAKYWDNFDTLDGEDQNTIIEEFVQRYIELANKRPGTAFARNDQITRGGGGERGAIGGIRELADKLKTGQVISENDLYVAAENVLNLIDIKFIQGHQVRYIDTIVRALQHAVLSVLVGLSKEQLKKLIEDLITGLGQRDGFPVNMAEPMYQEVLRRLSLN